MYAPPQAIRTFHEGVWMRSRLEAHFAAMFSAHGLRWQYEPQGFHAEEGVLYLPDFWLPEVRTIVEVKGVFDQRSAEKVMPFAEAMLGSGIMFLVAHDPRWAPQLVGPYEDNYCEAMPGLRTDGEGDGIVWARCGSCRGEWLMHLQFSYECRHCGAHDGNGHLAGWSGFDGGGTSEGADG